MQAVCDVVCGDRKSSFAVRRSKIYLPVVRSECLQILDSSHAYQLEWSGTKLASTRGIRGTEKEQLLADPLVLPTSKLKHTNIQRQTGTNKPNWVLLCRLCRTYRIPYKSFPNSHQLCTFELGQCVLISALTSNIQRRSGYRRSPTERVLVAFGRRAMIVISATIARAWRSTVVVVVIMFRTGETPGRTTAAAAAANTVSMLR